MQFSLTRLLRHQHIIGALFLFLLGWSLVSNASEEALQNFRDTFPQLSDSQLLNMVGAGDRLAELELACLLYTSPSPRDLSTSRMPSSA